MRSHGVSGGKETVGSTSSSLPVSHAVVLFFVTAGQNGENLGSDEEQIVLAVYQLYDIKNNKVVALQHHYVRPTPDDALDSDRILTEECRIQTGLNEDAIKNAQTLENVLDEFDRFLRSKNVHSDHGGRPFCIVTDGPLHLRLCLHPEASRKNMVLADYFYKFFDLRKEFKKFYKVSVINCIRDMLDTLSLETYSSLEYGIRHCQEMASIIHQLISDGHEFRDYDMISQRLEPGIFSKDEIVDDEIVVRARGLPWQCSDQDIGRFFRGLNIAKGGVALCLSQQGRRNGEALVCFDSKEQRDLALRKHKHHLGQRYIEVYRATGKDFVKVAGGRSAEAHEFLSRHANDTAVTIVRMRGLPYNVSAEQVLQFFRNGEVSVNVYNGEEGILFVHQADGRATGDAFVTFATDNDANRALTKHRQCVGSRYVELFKSTIAEVQQVLNRSMDPKTTPSPEATASYPLQTYDPSSAALLHDLSSQGLLMPQITSGQSSIMTLQSPLAPVIVPQQLVSPASSTSIRDCVRLRGLPLEATVTDIIAFLSDFARNVVFQGIHMVLTPQGSPSGEAIIQMDSELASSGVALAKNKRFILSGGRKYYIEVTQCSADEISGGMPVATNNNILPAQSIMGQSAPMSVPPPGLIQKMVIPNGNGSSVMPMNISPTMGGNLPATYTILPYGSSLAMAPMTIGAQTIQQASYYPVGLGQPALQQTIMAPQYATIGSGTTFQQQVPQLASISGRGVAAYSAASANGYQPVIYWYPSPPVSPQQQGLAQATAYYVPQSPTTIVMKGLPYNARDSDILQFLEGVAEHATPDVQIQRSVDGRATEAYITFASRGEAERAVTEKNRKLLGNRYVELHMA